MSIQALSHLGAQGAPGGWGNLQQTLGRNPRCKCSPIFFGHLTPKLWNNRNLTAKRTQTSNYPNFLEWVLILMGVPMHNSLFIQEAEHIMSHVPIFVERHATLEALDELFSSLLLIYKVLRPHIIFLFFSIQNFDQKSPIRNSRTLSFSEILRDLIPSNSVWRSKWFAKLVISHSNLQIFLILRSQDSQTMIFQLVV